MSEFIRSKNDLCTGCNRCVRECPMETANVTYQDEAGKIKVGIDHDKCIACGWCISACKHEARYFDDDTEKFFDDLSKGVPISLMVAPAIRTNIPGYKRLFTYLKRLGLNKIYDVSLGADISIWGHVKYVEKKLPLPIITQPCPVIVTYLETYRQDLLPKLSPVHGPVGCMSVYMKEYQGIKDRIALLSPCVAKKTELEDTGLGEYNVTFARLAEYIEHNDITLPDEETGFDHEECGLGSLFPMPGGLKENIEYFTGKKLHITKGEGFDIYEKLNEYARTPVELLPDIYDVLNCTEGCNVGPAALHGRNVFEIDKTMDTARRKATEERKREYYDSVYKKYDDTFDFSRFLRKYLPISITFPQITDEGIKASFELLGKTDYAKQHIDCGACGSNTCHGMARKIALGVNIPGNCIVKSKDDAKAEHAENMLAHEQLTEMEKQREADDRMRLILDATPFGAHFWDRQIKMIDCNQAALNLLELPDKQELMDNFAAYSPEYQPDGRLSGKTAFETLTKAFEDGYLRVEWTHQTKNGELLPCEVTLVRVDYKGDQLLVSYIRDLREHKRMMSDIERRDQSLNVINRVASILLAQTNETNFEKTLQSAMEIIGQSMEADCVQIWPNEMRDDKLCLVLSHKWLSDDGKKAPDVPIGTAMPYGKRWMELFLHGESVNGPIARLPQEDRELLSPLGFTSTITIPLFYQDKFWGVFCVNDVVKERYFPQDEIDMLHSATLMMVNAINRDSAQKELKSALAKTEAAILSSDAAQLTTSAMFESNPHINVLFDNNFKVVDCNPAALQFIGFETKEELLAGFTERMTKSIPASQPDGRASIPLAQRLMTAAKEGQIKFETEMAAGDVKRNLDVEFKRIPYKNSFAIVGYIYDMTEFYRVKEQNELQIAKLDMAVQASKIGLWDMEVAKDDPLNSNKALIWSDELRYMLGYKNETEFPNKLSSLTSRLHPDDKEKTLDAFAKHLMDTTGKTPFDLECRLLKKDGEYSYFHVAGATIREKNGKPVRIVGTLADITETKNIILDSERQRIQAEAANKAKSNFLSTMSHEIRTPMNAIIGMTAIGKLSNDVQKKDDALTKIDGASKHLLGIINDVLDMSKIEADKFELSPTSFNFEKMLQKIADVINLRIDERRQKFFIHIDKDIPHSLVGDDQRLAQVITNLLSNAVKFTPEEGAIHLDSRLLSEENGICRLKISVEDTGIGITDEQKARLFNSFEQAEATTTRKYGGTGLGLAISKRIVELMNGEIWVESESGKGSKFIFTFLMKRCTEIDRHLLDESVNWKNIRIFVVDDEPEIREVFTLVAENLKISCTVAASGEEAAKFLEEDDNYNIYFIDWKLPGMNGIEFARLIQGKAPHNSIVTIFSSVDWNLIEDEAKEAGVDKFLLKPLFPSVIVDVINTCISMRNEADEGYADRNDDDFTGFTILLADDVEINREIVLSLLEPTNLTVDCAENGAQAVKMFENAPEKYGMIFMDIQMPEMDGYEATRLIRGLAPPQAKTVPIVAMTANAFREDIEKSISVGMNGHISKPIDFDEVMEELRQYLR